MTRQLSKVSKILFACKYVLFVLKCGFLAFKVVTAFLLPGLSFCHKPYEATNTTLINEEQDNLTQLKSFLKS